MPLPPGFPCTQPELKCATARNIETMKPHLPASRSATVKFAGLAASLALLGGQACSAGIELARPGTCQSGIHNQGGQRGGTRQ